MLEYLNGMHHGFTLYDSPLLYNFSRLSTTENADLRTVFDGVWCKPVLGARLRS